MSPAMQFDIEDGYLQVPQHLRHRTVAGRPCPKCEGDAIALAAGWFVCEQCFHRWAIASCDVERSAIPRKPR